MTSNAPILVPIDFSECSDIAADAAAVLARRSGAPIFLLHVVRPPVELSVPEFTLPPSLRNDLLSAAGAKVESYRKKYADAGLSVEARTVEGIPSALILLTAEEISPRMIVMGTHGLTGLKHVLLGSVAERTLRNAHCPVLTVKHPIELADGHTAKLVVPLDFSDTGRRSLDAARLLAKDLGRAHLILINVQQVPVEYFELELLDPAKLERELTALSHKKLAAIESELRAEGLDVESVTTLGNSAKSIVGTAESMGADLIVICTHGRTGLSRLGIGSVAEKVVRSADCPVMTVPAAD